MKTQAPNSTPSHRTQKAASVSDMTVGSPLRQITKFALPLILGYILQQMYLVIDAVIVGRWIGVEALAAVGASTSITFLVMGFCNGACAGFAIPVAQAFGAKDYRKMRIYVANAVRVSAVIATVIMVLSLMSCHRILQMVNTPADIFHDAYTFLMLQFAAIPFTFGFNLLSGQIRALGNSRQPFYFLITSALVNILLDVVLILFCGMGVAGVGIATWLSQAVSVALCIWYIRKHMQLLIPQGDERRYDNRRTSILLNNGVPMGLQFSITGIGIIMLQSANNALGTTCVAAFTASLRIKYLFTCVFENIGVAMATYCGQNLGAQRMDRVTRGVKDAIRLMLAYFVFTFVVISLCRLHDAALRRQRRGCRGEQRCAVHAHQQLLLPHPRPTHHSALLHPGTRLQQPLHAQRRDGDDSTLRCQPMARASYRLDRHLLRRPCSMDYGRPVPRSGVPLGAA